MASRLDRTTPSGAGVDAAGINAFLDATKSLNLHSLMIVRSGEVLAEAWWHPYRPDDLQLVYSISKSFTSIAASFAITEGLFSLDDHVADLLGVTTDNPKLAQLTVRHLARMTTGHEEPLLLSTDLLEKSPQEIFQNAIPEREPGELWIYNNYATWLLAVLIQQKSGVHLTEYLRPRLFEQLDIEDWSWDEHDGLQFGWSGLHLATESLAKFGCLLVRGGQLHGLQVIDPAYLAEATTKQADNSKEPDGYPRDVSLDWRIGYGYGFWCQQQGFRADGAYGQFVVVLPDQQVTIAITAATENNQQILHAVWRHLLPAIDRTQTPGAEEALAKRLQTLQLEPVSSRSYRQIASFAPRDNYAFAAADYLGVYPQAGGVFELSFRMQDTTHTIQVGDRSWVDAELPGVPGRENVPVSGSGGWVDDHLFVAKLVARQTPHVMVIEANTKTETFSTRWETEPLMTSQINELGIISGTRGK